MEYAITHSTIASLRVRDEHIFFRFGWPLSNECIFWLPGNITILYFAQPCSGCEYIKLKDSQITNPSMKLFKSNSYIM